MLFASLELLQPAQGFLLQLLTVELFLLSPSVCLWMPTPNLESNNCDVEGY